MPGRKTVLRWGLVGTGAIANKRVAPALQTAANSQLIAVGDVIEESARDLARRFNVPVVYSSLDELLANTEVDAVYLATPVHLHASQAVQALKTGKHVLVEKPMALSSREAEEMARTARQAGKTLATAYYRRFFPKVARARRLIAEGSLGQIVMVVSVYHTWYDPAPGSPGSWRSQKAQAGGGVLWDMGSHRFDLLIDLFGMPVEVWAATATLAHRYEVEDTASVYMKLLNGAQCMSTWQWSSQTWVDHLSIIGTTGKIVMEPVDSPNLTLFIGKGRTQERTDEELPLPDNVHLPMIQNFVDSVLRGEDPVEVAEEGLKVNRILDAIDRSASTGCVVEP
jgi:predicted dehydrogenase